MSKYKILMTGGGTGGHVIPNLALIPRLQQEDFDIFYIGSINGIERKLIEETGIKYHPISSGKLRRYFDIKNFTDPFKVVKGLSQAFFIIKKEKPDVVFSKGGFVAVPVVIAASMLKIPVVAHESDITPGLANKLSQPYVSKLCVTFPESIKYVKDNKGVVTGTPIREELFKGNAEKALKFLNFTGKKPVILIMGGSLGSKVINESIRNNLDLLTSRYDIVHLCGKGNLDDSLNGKQGYRQFEYINEELKDIMALSSMIITRGGSNSLFEILALKKPNIIIPLSRAASRGDQILNAASFEKSGYSIVIQEEELNSNILLNKINLLEEKKATYINNMRESKLQGAIDKIVNIIKESIKDKR
ncbi:UDP-N-acetylglucosamine-N-acetylmuramyl-(pentapeptide) pyrophosphoryl-undecaprenol N-acetylglucosamine transferase [Clostridium bornimense]|uniref:UDP-N-acetylglucosamine--N-acetylmuramyl-(pentapeptide) pyrophosphoryl-undecaprenol N-acetylglucosamine transferase n=1 Tax=Clostridium bornimense TaxID=1216932 RepID=W6RYL5_9CLOT|nr:undecaprenyldiphospho-muramoylpentapeptide beta-N-acetylglucosaminyltransferase [Clostridium bornimense]CDM68714.1 UDP-N-acetylglucosamine-N-acetylmuramyl-(pentapeptide) pyrophosphoryl-undecaprenol N-acetylglucosamine transferase [Clostridium bornimense]